MTKTVHPSTISGSLSAAASKSVVQRLVALASLADGQTTIRNVTLSDDVRAALYIAESLGAKVHQEADAVIIDGMAFGRQKTSAGDSRTAGAAGAGVSEACGPLTLDCGESGLSMRMFAPVAALFERDTMLTGRGSLLKRPMFMIEESLRHFAVRVSSSDGHAPLSFRGPLCPARATIDGSASSQLLSGLLIALPLLAEDSVLTIKAATSRPYLNLTLQAVSRFGGQIQQHNWQELVVQGGCTYTSPGVIPAEGDWSGAAFFLVAAALTGELVMDNLVLQSCQGDKEIITALRQAGALVEIAEASDNSGTAAIRIKQPASLQAFDFDATECPDLFPPLVALASACNGISRIQGAGRLRHKESDRASALSSEFGKLGIRVVCEGNLMTIHGGRPSAAAVQSHGDHRIAMAAAVAALRASGPVVIHGSEAVSKSWPAFFEDLVRLGVQIDE